MLRCELLVLGWRFVQTWSASAAGNVDGGLGVGVLTVTEGGRVPNGANRRRSNCWMAYKQWENGKACRVQAGKEASERRTAEETPSRVLGVTFYSSPTHGVERVSTQYLRRDGGWELSATRTVQ